MQIYQLPKRRIKYGNDALQARLKSIQTKRTFCGQKFPVNERMHRERDQDMVMLMRARACQLNCCLSRRLKGFADAPCHKICLLSMQVRSALASKVSKERVGTELRSMIRGALELHAGLISKQNDMAMRQPATNFFHACTAMHSCKLDYCWLAITLGGCLSLA